MQLLKNRIYLSRWPIPTIINFIPSQLKIAFLGRSHAFKSTSKFTQLFVVVMTNWYHSIVSIKN